MIPLQSVRDGIDIVTIEKVSPFGLMLLFIAILLYYVWTREKIIKELRSQIDKNNAKHEEKLKEINDAMMAELRNSANAYKEQSETLKLIMKSQQK
jgi:predicted Holliday junction resolvase-like endonuclease